MRYIKLYCIIIAAISPLWMMAQHHRTFDIVLQNAPEERLVLAAKAPEFAFHLPQMAGNFRLGVSNGTNSLWGNEVRQVSVDSKRKGKLVYTLKDPILEKGTIAVRVAKLSDSNGMLMEVSAEQIPVGIDLIWSFGGCYGKVIEERNNSTLLPEYCIYNVFSVEGTAFTVYYGESMNLKVIQAVTPLSSAIRLSDAHKQASPLQMFESGKKTDAPALAASTPLKEGEKLYFVFYTQNEKADYNYYMLPKLFTKEFER